MKYTSCLLIDTYSTVLLSKWCRLNIEILLMKVSLEISERSRSMELKQCLDSKEFVFEGTYSFVIPFVILFSIL